MTACDVYRCTVDAPAQLRIDDAAARSVLAGCGLSEHADALLDAVHAWLAAHPHGDLPRWQAALDALPVLAADRMADHMADRMADRMVDHVADLAADRAGPLIDDDGAVCMALPHDDTLRDTLMQLCPWRKGPYRFGDVFIDSEWRSDWKWNRIAPRLGDLSGQSVLDVGCGNGYHLWRMREAGARCAIGIDPGLLFLMQYQVVQRYRCDPAVLQLPLTLDALPRDLHCFDTVFSMGVLYHRRDALAHLEELASCLRPGGRLVLETLIAPGEDDRLIPTEDRYARMRNVHGLPTMLHVARWLQQAGFAAIRCVSVDITSVLEQRTTEWMPWESLADALDPDDRSLTVEGLPRPRRAVMLATRP